MPDLTTILGGSGGVAFLGILLGWMHRRIDTKVPMDVHTAMCESLNQKVDGLQEDQKETTKVVQDVRVMVERIDAKLNGAGR